MKTAEFYIGHLGLKAHPEGGFFSEIYRSEGSISNKCLPEGYEGPRNYATSIYFLLKSGSVSRFHKLKSDEIWNFLDGSPVRIYILDPFGKLSEIRLGKNLECGEFLQYVIKRENWFASEVADSGSYSLVSCLVAPGFDFNDFILGDKDELQKIFPQYKDLIERFS